MDVHEARQYVIRQLGRHGDRNDIVFKVAEELGYQWDQADAFVSEIEGAEGRTIGSRRNRSLILISGIMALGGFVGLLAITLATLDGWIVFLLRIPIPYLGNILIFLSSLGIMIGGGLGFFRTMRTQLSGDFRNVS